MAVKYICDGCGKEQVGARLGDKPPDWFQRQDEDGVQHACSRKCIEEMAFKGYCGVFVKSSTIRIP